MLILGNMQVSFSTFRAATNEIHQSGNATIKIMIEIGDIDEVIVTIERKDIHEIRQKIMKSTGRYFQFVSKIIF